MNKPSMHNKSIATALVIAGLAGPAWAVSLAAANPAESVDELVGKIVAVLEKSHCFFADLLEKFPKAGYKTVANSVARLYENGKISQDKDGKLEPKVLQN